MRKRAVAGCLGFAILAASACRNPENRVQLLELRVTSLTRAVDFYHGVFGWEVSRPDSSYAVLAARPVAIGLMARDSVAGVASVTVVVAVRELETVFARVVSHGGLIRKPIELSWRGRQFRFADPDGNEIVVWSDRAGAGNPR